MEKKLLSAALYDRGAFDRLRPHLTDKDFSDKGQILYRLISEYYDCDIEAQSVDKGLLSSTISREYPRHSEQFIATIEGLKEVSVPNLLKEVYNLKKKGIAYELSNALLNGSDEEVEKLVTAYTDCTLDTSEATEGDDDTIYRTDLTEFFAQAEGERIPLAPETLNDLIDGGVLRGHHIVIFAQTEVGKSLFALNIACSLCKNGFRVLYVGNEEPLRDMITRVLCRMTGWDKYRVRKNYGRAQTRAERKGGYDNLIMKATPGGTPTEIEGWISKFEPDIVIVDQIHKMVIPGSDGEQQNLEKASSFMRTMGKKHKIVPISLTQASDQARLILKKRDIHGSKTLVAGDADLMLGIGVNDGFEAQGKRMISICKNKISGDHSHFVVGFDKDLSKVTSE